MKKIRYCKITILILAGWAILSAIGFLGKDTIYSRYTVDPVKTPYFVLVMQGIHDGIYPWSSDHESLWDKWEHLAELRRDEEQISATESTDCRRGNGEYGRNGDSGGDRAGGSKKLSCGGRRVLLGRSVYR